ncbi:extracellular solute-binding protein [Bradyrhizobium sp. sGM-13]|uniref:extracellular solute-binding protein n=1 Tax=Bradyrhizobium sp. sGM-13 TaxID=2831781 RepID=UPI001BCA7EA0|nr:extracellular solute-binding protein [Bradyrhizobium sp. sGM-13]
MRHALLIASIFFGALSSAASPAIAQNVIRVTAAPAAWAPMLQELAAQFKEQYPEITVKIEAKNRDFESLTEQTLREAITGDLPDITLTGSNQIRVFVERGYAVDLGQFMSTDREWGDVGYSSAAADTGRIDGHEYGLTLAASMPVIVYNKDLVAKAGADPEAFPSEWPDIINLGRKIPAIDRDMGLFFEHESNGNWTYLALLESAGGKIATPSNDVAFASEQGLWALDVIRQIGEAGQARADMSRDQARQAFTAGKLGALVTASSAIGGFQKQIGGRFSLGVAPFPLPSPNGRLPVAGLTAVLFSKDQAKAHAAWKFLKFAMTPSSQAVIVKSTGMIPFNERAINDPNSLRNFYSSEPLFAVALLNRDRVTSWYSFPGPNSIKIFNTIKDILQKVMTIKMPPEQALQEMKSKVAALLAR